MENFRSFLETEGTYWGVTYAPLPLVRQFADEVRVLLRDSGARSQISKIVREAMMAEWSNHRKQRHDADQQLIEKLHGREVRKLNIAETRELLKSNGFGGEQYAKRSWPFPILHGIDSSPGCCLIFVALNELAVLDPTGFDPRHESVVKFDDVGHELCFAAYRIGWESVGQRHTLTMRDVFAAVRNTLTAPIKKQTGSRKVGRPSDTDHANDNRIWEAWNSGAYATRKDLACAFQMSERKAINALERQRKRRERSSPSKPPSEN